MATTKPAALAARGVGRRGAFACALLLLVAALGSHHAGACCSVITVRNSAANPNTNEWHGGPSPCNYKYDPNNFPVPTPWGGMQEPPECPRGWTALASYNTTQGGLGADAAAGFAVEPVTCTIEVICGLGCTSGGASGASTGAPFLSDSAAQVLALVSAAANTLILAVLLAMFCGKGHGSDGSGLAAAKAAGYASLQ